MFLQHQKLPKEIIFLFGSMHSFYPVVPATWKAKVGGSLESQVPVQPGQHRKTPSPFLPLLKLCFDIPK